MADEQANPASILNFVPVDTSGATIVPGRYVTQVGVQWGADEVTLLFFEVKSPLSPFPDPDQTKAYLESFPFRPAECVGRMILNTEVATNLVDLLQKSLASAQMVRQQRFFTQLDEMMASAGIADEFKEFLRTHTASPTAPGNE